LKRTKDDEKNFEQKELKFCQINIFRSRVMKSFILTAVICLMLFNNCLYGSVSWIANRSFEYDGAIPSILVELPTGWDSITVPDNKFRGGVFSDWSSDDIYSVALISKSFIALNEDDTALLSQSVYFTDVNDMFFDMKLDTSLLGTAWSNDFRLAVIKIDDDVVWDSSVLGSGDLRGEYIDDPNLVISSETLAPYRDGEAHELSLGLVVTQTEALPFAEYFAWFDFIRFDTHCEGYGYLDSDFNHDCFVNFIDYGMLANHWMDEVEDYNMFDLDPNNVIDANDLEIFLVDWLGTSYGQEDQYIESDLNYDGIVNFVDYGMLDFSEYTDPNNLSDELVTLIEQWLWTNWMYWVDE
jgi:hypothetical protein